MAVVGLVSEGENTYNGKNYTGVEIRNNKLIRFKLTCQIDGSKTYEFKDTTFSQ